MKRIQISTSVSQRTRDQADELIAKFDYSLRDVVTLGIEKLYQEKQEETKMPKPARIMIRNQQGRHSLGTAQSADMVLVAGRKGQGKVLYTSNYWPWSPKSVEAAEDYVYSAAKRLGYEIVHEE